MNKIVFLGSLSESSSAIKFDGKDGNGKIVFDFPRTEKLNVLGILALTETLVKVTVEIADDKTE